MAARHSASIEPAGRPAEVIVSGAFQLTAYSLATGERLWWLPGMAWQAKSLPVLGRIGGNVWRGLARSDVKELGELIDSGEAALLVIGASTLEAALEKAQLNAEKHIAKELGVSTDDVDAAVQEAASEIN